MDSPRQAHHTHGTTKNRDSIIRLPKEFAFDASNNLDSLTADDVGLRVRFELQSNTLPLICVTVEPVLMVASALSI